MNKSATAFVPLKVKVSEDGGVMSFSAYGNVKNVKDHAWDIAVDGCYQASIDKHKANGTMPRLLWSHDPSALPVGKITHMEEDEYGLKFEGELTDHEEGIKIYKSLKHGALDSFSIGYRVKDEEWSQEAGANLLKEIDIREISFVNFACNEMSTLREVKSDLEDGKLPTKRELQNHLRSTGLSKSQAEKIVNNYDPEKTEEVEDIFDQMAKSDDDEDPEKTEDIFDIIAKAEQQ